jgi:integrase
VRQAGLILAKFILEKEAHEAKPAAERPLTVREALDIYFDEWGHATRSYVQAENAIGYFLAFMGDKAVVDLTQQDINAYEKARKAGTAKWQHPEHRTPDPKYRTKPRGLPAKAGTIQREVSVLLAAINHCAKNYPKRLPPVLAPELTKPKGSSPRPHWLTVEQWRKHIAQIEAWRPDVARFCRLAVATGARREALCELTWFQVDFDARLIHLNPHGREQTKKRRPTIGMSSTLYDMLKAWRRETDSPFVLGGMRATQATALLRYYSYSRGVRPLLTPHIFRHTFATWALHRRRTTWEIAQALGTTEKMIEETYGHGHDSVQQRTAETVAQALEIDERIAPEKGADANQQ